MKRAGIGALSDPLKDFRQAGGQSTFVVGIDHEGSSIQGLRSLYEAADRVHIYHDRSRSRTFHPKTYLFDCVGGRSAVAFVGSGNLTSGGLYSNYESIVRLDLDLSIDADLALLGQMQAFFDSCTDTSSECLRHLSPVLLRALKPFLCDETTQVSQGGSSSGQDQPGLRSLFGSAHALAYAPRFTSGSSRKTPKKSRPAKAAGLPTLGKGFWKVLSKFDVSTTSAPGQMIIPIEFRDYFRSLHLSKKADPSGGGRQWETTVPVEFHDGSFSKVVPDGRCIVYEPKITHPRPNMECRFTFRDRQILVRLTKGDILEFRPILSSPGSFSIQRVAPGSVSYRRHYPGTGPRFGALK